MAFAKSNARKVTYIAEATMKGVDLVSAAELEVVDMPAGTVVDDVYLSLDETFNPTTSAVIEAGIAGSTNILLASQNVFTGQTLGGRSGAATGKGYRFASGGAIVAKYTSGDGQATQGQARLVVEFHYENESDYTVK